MGNDYEKTIVRNFFIKNRQDRILFELSSPNRRKNAILRLSHSYLDLLDEKYMIEIPKPNSDYVEIAKLLKKYSAADNCYSISINVDIDGKLLPLIDALKGAVGLGLPSIVFSDQGEIAYFEAEQSFGSPPRFILKK